MAEFPAKRSKTQLKERASAEAGVRVGLLNTLYRKTLATFAVACACVCVCLFITAHDSPEARADAESLGCAGYFRKTDAGDALLSAIRRVTDALGLVNGFKKQ